MFSDEGVAGRWYIVLIEYSMVQGRNLVMIDWGHPKGFETKEGALQAYKRHPFAHARTVVYCKEGTYYEYLNGFMVY